MAITLSIRTTPAQRPQGLSDSLPMAASENPVPEKLPADALPPTVASDSLPSNQQVSELISAIAYKPPPSKSPFAKRPLTFCKAPKSNG